MTGAAQITGCCGETRREYRTNARRRKPRKNDCRGDVFRISVCVCGVCVCVCGVCVCMCGVCVCVFIRVPNGVVMRCGRLIFTISVAGWGGISRKTYALCTRRRRRRYPFSGVPREGGGIGAPESDENDAYIVNISTRVYRCRCTYRSYTADGSENEIVTRPPARKPPLHLYASSWPRRPETRRSTAVAEAAVRTTFASRRGPTL